MAAVTAPSAWYGLLFFGDFNRQEFSQSALHLFELQRHFESHLVFAKPLGFHKSFLGASENQYRRYVLRVFGKHEIAVRLQSGPAKTHRSKNYAING